MLLSRSGVGPEILHSLQAPRWFRWQGYRRQLFFCLPSTFPTFLQGNLPSSIPTMKFKGELPCSYITLFPRPQSVGSGTNQNLPWHFWTWNQRASLRYSLWSPMEVIGPRSTDEGQRDCPQGSQVWVPMSLIYEK